MNGTTSHYAPKIFGIPDSVCEQVGIIGQWMAGDKIGIHANSHTTSKSSDKPSEYVNHPAFIHHLKLDVVLFDPIVRKLVNESNGTFLAVQKVRKSKVNQNDIQSEYLKLSRQYRSIVRACLENLQEVASNFPLKKEQYLKYVAIFYNIEYIWHLCEILFIDVVPGKWNAVLPQMLDWIRFHFPKCEQQTNRVVASIEGGLSSTLGGSGGGEAHPEYWHALTGLVLQGRVGEARGLLRLHSSARQEAFRAIDEALRTMPVYTVYGGFSVTEFDMRWRCWQVSCSNKIDAGVFSSWPELDFIARILAGQEKVLDEAAKECESWEQMLAAWLLYTDPTVKSFHLGSHASRCIAQFRSQGGKFSVPKAVDSLILSLMESNLHQVGVSYLDHCPTEGEACLNLLLPRVPLTSEKRALKVIQIAKQRDLRHIVLSTCKVMGKRALARKQYGLALAWALRSQDAGFATHLADRFLEGYSASGEFASDSHSYLDLLDNLGSCMLISGRLTFLGKYCEFHRLYRAGDFREAAALLVSLLSSHLAPKYFWMTLLMDAVPLLESNDVVLTSDDTYALMHCLEELITDRNSEMNRAIGHYPIPYSEDYDDDLVGDDMEDEMDDLTIDTNTSNKVTMDRAFKRKEGLIRLALGRNLARAIVHEMSNTE
ncbi:hypothetical protein J437_LFUL000200 [Ladona fulva]|uniref:Nuclear pore complex protein Nup85 n=1 Tax=Ladona fulva TaxID=123851 RepID=A0A8K0P3Z4_LADFU|nr:hypothetical protein J437_LFUL000200 [Ladona fulva]